MPLDVSLDDAALVRRSLGGDQEAFGVLVSRHARSILSVTSRMLGPTADAEDVAQETFVAAFKSLVELSVRCEVLDVAVSDRREQVHRRAAGAPPDRFAGRASRRRQRAAWEAADEETPQWELEQVELAWELDKGIQALPHLYRESFVLRHIEGLGYDEMSAILGVHRDTLKMRVYKARTMLCQSLAHLRSVRT